MKMKKGVSLNTYSSNYSPVLLNLLFAVLTCLEITEAQNCVPSGQVMGTQPPPSKCNQENDSECCKPGTVHQTFTCSLHPVHPAVNGFAQAEDGGGTLECDGQFHDNNTPIVALLTGWFKFRNMKRCMNNIATTDECDSTRGCDEEHDYQPPYHNNLVDASKAVWRALGVPEEQWGQMPVTWVDA
ncbi:hypothetical protein MKX01_041999 [Papaver californicum]|nr:hypothetical protein MKX01_041999 [Papaver californicum]